MRRMRNATYTDIVAYIQANELIVPSENVTNDDCRSNVYYTDGRDRAYAP